MPAVANTRSSHASPRACRPAWGWRVWGSSKLLASLLAAEPQLVARKTVLEVGAGAGLAGLAAIKVGATAVCATDVSRALPLLRHNLQLNGARRVSPSAEPSQSAVCCPAGHELVQLQASSDDYICNVFGIDDLLSDGVQPGCVVHSCRTCDFDVCDQCVCAARAGRWDGLPGWFKLQCEGESAQVSAWASADDASPSFVCHPFDLLAHADREEMLTAVTALLSCMGSFGMAQPTVVLMADVSCSADLIGPMVMMLEVLRAVLPSYSEALVVHECREKAVDEALMQALSDQNMPFEELPCTASDVGVIENLERLQPLRVQLRSPLA